MVAATVTVVFTDLVGSTALLSRVGEDRAEALRREHFGLLREAIADSGGTEVKNLGDGLMVVFGSAADGVAGAVAIQQALERRNRDASEPLRVRVGVSLGDADVEDGDYFGVPVVEAARLCANADGGEIFVTDVVRALTGSRGGFEFASVGALELKGLDQPMSASRVVWVPYSADELAIPFPGRVATAASSAFVGRAHEREGLFASLKAVAAGARRVVLISGEPGIGKTSLSAGLARDAFDGGAVVLYGRCDEDLGIPYQPWAEALAHLVAHGPEDLLAAHVAARGSELTRLVPDLATRTQLNPTSSSDGESERYLLFGAVVDLLARVSALAPVVLLLDDLHWADRQTVQLLRHVVSAETPLRLLVIGTFRESDFGADHPLAEALAALHRESGVERVALRGLGDDELLTLLEATAGHEMNEDGVALRDALSAETEGNPFFIGEMLRHLAETQAIAQNERGQWVAGPDLRTSGLPVSIREVIGRRVARLGPEAQRVLSLAAVIGRDFDLSLLAAAVDLDEDTLIDLCDTAVSAAVLAETDTAGRYAFAHALIERTLYDGLSGSRRAHAHRTIAEALEELCGDEPGARIGELAYHWVHATQPQDGAKAIAYAQRAGDRALEQLAPDEARRWYRDALDLLDRAPDDDPRRRAELLLGLGDAQRQTGDPANRETLLTAARLADRIDAIDILVRAALRNTRGYASSTGVVDREAVEILTLALTRLGERDSPDRARLLALRCLEGSYDADFDERLTIATDAVDMARRTGDTAALVDAIRHGITAIAAPQTLELRLQWIVEACDLADGLRDPTARHHAYLLRTETALEAGDLATMRTATARFEAEGERLGQPICRWMKAYTRAVRQMLEGDLGAAEQSATEALTLGVEAAQPDAAAIYGAQLLGVRWQQGRLVEMVPLIQQAVLDIPGQPGYRAALVWAKSHDGQSREVTQLLDAEVADGLPMFVLDVGLTVDVLWAETASRVGHRPAATMLHQRLLPWAEQITATNITVAPGVAHYLGLLAHVLGRHDEADQWFAQALALHERMESRFFIALTQTAWAALLADRNHPGDVQQARVFLDAALPVATAGGYGYIEHDARALLKRID